MDELNDDFEDLPITYTIDNAILMHRDAHFSGSFPIMLEYYRNEGQGICPEFEIGRIEELAQTEAKTGKNLSATLLSGPEAEKVGRARESYKKLQSHLRDRQSKKYPPKTDSRPDPRRK